MDRGSPRCLRRPRLGVVASALALALLVGCADAHYRTPASPQAGIQPVSAVATTNAMALTEPGSAVATSSTPSTAPKPRIVWDPIPFGAARKAQTTAYVRRHYGSFMKPTWRLVNPHVIVIHFTESSTFRSAWNTFGDDVPDPELHELPATCAHFVVDKNGAIYQLVSLGVICRHTVGLNWTAIGIEHVAYSDAQVLDNRRQISASLRLVRWLRCRFHIQIRDVIGHNESLSSRYHREDVPALRNQTHDDFNHVDMQAYRRRLRSLGGCPGS
jgi:N-acetylmuramoyl-L-alanine amidase